eukprot:4636842-Alexandrium_andersonii.AAC.1
MHVLDSYAIEVPTCANPGEPCDAGVRHMNQSCSTITCRPAPHHDQQNHAATCARRCMWPPATASPWHLDTA